MRRDRAADAADGHPVLRLRERSGQRDLEACVGVLAAVHKADGYPVNWPDEPGTWLEGADAIGAWVAELDGRVVGHVALSRPGPGDAAPGLWGREEAVTEAVAVTEAEAVAVMSRLYVAPDARGHGIGALLMGRALREARGRGLRPVLDVVSSDRSATALYERMGWQLLGVVEQEWEPGQRVVLHCYAAPGGE
ncbi:GNAT family N-acetyltransferase [Streptomyces sp. Je 1-369]|uniref:GNAT family N-acetyltransferase n=1 Tax=Streptomyces sp. Je 1-369 TaxID=2966192 RepID=UPI0022853C5E|nr:GNAT family N-acetyltransferase [Streptomyces sp. Je 1-369]WAL96496.1 GNAT family N-acetyltransferase [Streptomyces sp. Je 1-369]